MQNEIKKLRHEYKHGINYSDYFVLRQRLKAVATLDANVGEDGTYSIRSLYFDNYQDKALREKIDGVHNREKFRIRFYNGDDSFIQLEKKSKINGLCKKDSICITREECERILVGDIEWITKRKEELLIELYAKMRFQQLKPKVIVDYIREPYIYNPGNVRITIDSQIRTGLHCIQLFNPNLHTILVPDHQIILEVKYDEFLPELIASMIQLKDRRAGAYSKYAACRMYN